MLRKSSVANQIVGVIWFGVVLATLVTGAVGVWQVGWQLFMRSDHADWSGVWLIVGAGIAGLLAWNFIDWYKPTDD